MNITELHPTATSARIEFRRVMHEITEHPDMRLSRREIFKIKRLMRYAKISPEFALFMRDL